MRTLQDIQPGQTLGRYEFLVPIAEGGMASVWAARLKGSRGFSKTVAVKTMLPSVSDDPQFEQMFLDEAQIASRIRHPNVAEILDLGEQDEVLYLVMEWVDGEPLSNLRRAAAKFGGIPRNIAIRVVADACAGLHTAHELKDDGGQLIGLVHRDISPQNLLVTFDGVVKIVDFGVAKAAGRSTGQTTAGQVKGKPPYMSPEQALGEPVDRRTDVFALGIILYQLTTGKHPFRGESDLVTLQNIVSDRPIVTPRAYDKQYPRALEALVMKALDRKRELRFQTCAQFEAAIDEVFAKEIPRARTEDVGKFMQEMLGSRGEARRKALADSIRAADERAAGRSSLIEITTMPRIESTSLTPASGTTASAERRPGTDPLGAPVTPFGATISTTVEKKGRKGLAIGVALTLAFGIGAFAALRPHSKPEPAPPVAAAAAGPVAAAPEVVAVPPPVPAAPVTDEHGDNGDAVPASSAKPGPHMPGVRGPHVWRPVAGAKPGVKPATPTAGTGQPGQTSQAGQSGQTNPSGPTGKPGFLPPPVSDPGF